VDQQRHAAGPGTYGRALWDARRTLSGVSRTQAGGVVATGAPVRCGAARRAASSPTASTAGELRTRLFHGAQPTKGEFTDGVARAGPRPPVADTRFASEGHGAYRGKLDENWEPSSAPA
jgi:hypothetical protein